MEHATTEMLRIGDWCVNPTSGLISRDGETTRLEARAMGLLLCLATRAGKVVSIEDLLTHVWPGVIVTPDSVYQAVASLRRVLGDDPRQPSYIVTVPRLGYRLVAQVSPWKDQPTPSMGSRSLSNNGSAYESATSDTSALLPRGGSRSGVKWTFLTAMALGLFAAFLAAFHFQNRIARSNLSTSASNDEQRQQSIAVLPFLDLTDGMNEEPFADGMTEELIDKFSKIPYLRVPSPTSSFYFKGKQIPIADIAKKLGVACVLDGSVRKSGNRVRIATRLIHANNGFVIWSETYDRPLDDILVVQDEIADEVTKRLRASIEAKPDHDKSQ